MFFNKKPMAICSVFLLSASLTGCIRAVLPTSEIDLENRARIVSGDVDLDVVSTYANLKTYMQKCLIYSNQYGYHDIDAKLDREEGRARFIGKSNYNTYTFKVSLEEIGKNKTKITYFSPKKKIGFSESNPQKRLDEFTRFALYDGKATCKL
ncbi:hypothetical protein [Psychrobacter sp. FDAARGOS_221]|uniref:hypothetical protein n=1 Tax=Psychrobacter sp. FDAARGOS_221 TaxID=1975705 RepID=UPI000BB56CD2|nr:hypothetical protein [Psychrobacter sp. FDAARGOS_221]PNK60966.1 hypothetical protein A6J60_008785 [Psychrobacter sp. FDAARGOS_221]